MDFTDLIGLFGEERVKQAVRVMMADLLEEQWKATRNDTLVVVPTLEDATDVITTIGVTPQAPAPAPQAPAPAPQAPAPAPQAPAPAPKTRSKKPTVSDEFTKLVAFVTENKIPMERISVVCDAHNTSFSKLMSEPEKVAAVMEALQS